MIKAIVFDLDGTISDSSEGIYESFNYALKKIGKNSISKNEVKKYIGPPLFKSFSIILNTNNDKIVTKAVNFFREHYISEGFKLNKLYQDIDIVIKELNKKYSLFIATTKKKEVACKVLDMFDLKKYFQKIYGGASKISKSEMLQMIMDDYNFNNLEIIMVGDTAYDIEGALEKNIVSIGAKWGFGTLNEISKANIIAEKPIDILKFYSFFQ